MTALNIARDAEQNCEALAGFQAVEQTHELDLLFRCKPIEINFYYEK